MGGAGEAELRRWSSSLEAGLRRWSSSGEATEALPTSRSGLVSGTHRLEAQDRGVGGPSPVEAEQRRWSSAPTE